MFCLSPWSLMQVTKCLSWIIFIKYQHQVKTNDLMYYPLAKGIMPIMLLPIASALLRSSQTANPIFSKAAELISLDFLTHLMMTEALLCKAMTI